MTGPAFIREEVSLIAPYNSGLTSGAVAARYAPAKISKLGSNENPFGPSPTVQQALGLAALNLHLYPDPAGTELRQAIGRRHHVGTDQIVLGNGSEDLLSVICKTVLRPSDRMVTLFPSFPLHEDYAVVMGAKVERVSLQRDLTIDVQAFAEAASSSPRLVMFANPMNPVGAWLNSTQLGQVFDRVSNDTLLVIDEAYAEYAAGVDYTPATDLLTNRSNWIVLRTFSKAWGLAALRVGYAVVGDPVLSSFLDRTRTPFNVNGMAQAAALAALADESHMLTSVAATVQERERVRSEIDRIGLRTAPSRGNFLFIDVGRDASLVSEGLLSQGVIVKPWKQNGYTTFLRASIGTTAENNHFLEALRSVL